MKRVLITVALAAIFLFVAIESLRIHSSPTSKIPAQVQGLRIIELKGQTIRVSVADNERTREQGLSGRQGLAADEGMLFVFPRDGTYAFWMKDMRFPIDILWLSASDRPSRDGSAEATVVYMAQNVSPDTYPENFMPDTSARYVLELPAGYAGAHTVEIGDRVEF